ncbi:hypothetical protein CIG75_12720 [Tumebacillus algifaecis]|uniref:DUF2313 domain-containing protein n=1 Tax=Tumebacillus algifaecis TaxID=1214604 RepID=A0A223D2C9_9BACL|nr:putative phage tail protein [Tumebacillus algifaecis]ASS75762.1 hypothetical protein CIG75_12720 [Tumebacillus algifaecis]
MGHEMDLLRKFLPRKWFESGGASGIDQLLKMVAAAMHVSQSVVEKVYAELSTELAVTTLSDWERQLGLPSGQNLDLDSRRKRIISRQWQRGGPTNTLHFEAALSLIFGVDVRVVSDSANYRMIIEWDEGERAVVVDLAEEYIKHNKLAFLAHTFQPKIKTEPIFVRSKSYSWKEDLPICGEFYCDDGGEGRLYDESISIQESGRHFATTQPPLCGVLIAGEEE